ncbi:MAG: GNAT family N-acetyltransferase [Chloroflexi bacterium]|nr:GNAT family N-acetyltransferase [Chloroflexota bacterium]
MNNYNLREADLDEFARLFTDPSPTAQPAPLHQRLQQMKESGITHLRSHLNTLNKNFAKNKTVIEQLGLELLQEKQVFVWPEPRPPLVVPTRLVFRSLLEQNVDTFLDVIARAHIGTLDRVEQAIVARAARGELDLHAWVRHEFETVGEHFTYEPAWWQLAYTKDGKLVGYIQSVLFQGNYRGNLGEATLYYIGVVPEQRGHGYGYDLLAKTVAILQTVGIWQIYCDTDCQNFPMIKAFEQAGFAESGHNLIWHAPLQKLIGRWTRMEE